MLLGSFQFHFLDFHKSNAKKPTLVTKTPHKALSHLMYIWVTQLTLRNHLITPQLDTISNMGGAYSTKTKPF